MPFRERTQLMPVAPQQVTQILNRLVTIESVTPWLIATGSGESAVARYIADWLSRTGAEVEIVDVQRGRPNVLARLRANALPERAYRHRRLRGLARSGAGAANRRRPQVRARRGR